MRFSSRQSDLGVHALTSTAVALSLLILPSIAPADCINYEDYLHPVGVISTPAFNVTMAGSLAYVGAGSSGLRVIDLSNPRVPKVVGNVRTPKVVHGVTVSGAMVYAAAGYSLLVIDVTDPASPTILGSIDTPGDAYGVAVSGTMAYVADGGSGLQVIDVSNPSLPVIVGHVDTPDIAEDVAITGTTACVADHRSGLQIIDVSNPDSPVLLASVGTSDVGAVSDAVSASGTYAYVTDSIAGINIVDVSSPSTPTVFNVRTSPYAQDIAVRGTVAYVAGWFDGLLILNLSNTSLPEILGSVDCRSNANGVAVAGTLACVAEDNLLEVFDIANPESPHGLNFPVGFYGATVSGTRLYTVKPTYPVGLSELDVVDVANPDSPSILGSVVFPGDARQIGVAGTVACVADGSPGLQLIDVSDPASPKLLGSVETPDEAFGVEVVGTLAFVADYTAGLQIIDITNPALPTIVGSVDTPGVARGVSVQGTIAYVADLVGLQVIDVSNPASPTILRTVNTRRSADAVVVSGTMAYVAGYYLGLQIIDVSDPASAEIVGNMDVAYGGEEEISVVGTVAYITDATNLWVFDVSNPMAPRLLGGHQGGSAYDGLSIVDDTVYYSKLILPVQCQPTTTVLLSSFQAISRADGILLSWATSSEADFAGFHVESSLSPVGGYRRLTSQPIPPGSDYRFLDRTPVVGATSFYRLEALDRAGDHEFFGPVSARFEGGEGDALRPVLGLASPNPFLGASTIIPFTVATAGDVRIGVFDLSGRRVRGLVNGAMGEGDHSVPWDGRNDRGELVPAGIYLYQLQAPGFEATRKLVRLR